MHQVYALILAAIAGGIIYIEAPVGGASAVTADCTITPAYRTGTTLTAPAFVHIECTATTHTDADVRPFHDLRYVIDYNDDACDSGSGAWTNSDSGALKNRDISPVGGHVYECAGTFTMGAEVCDATGDCDTWTSASFTVESEDAGYPTTATKCVSTSGTFTDCPAGATQTTSSDYDATLVTTAGSRTLYRCGETFTASADVNTSSAASNNSLIGTYGGTQPCTATVTMSYTGTLHSSLTSQTELAGWKTRDIIYNAAGTSSSDAVWTAYAGASGANKANFMLLRVQALGVGVCPTIGNTPNTADVNELPAFVSTYCLHDEAGSSDWSLFEYVSMQRGLVIDNYWNATVPSGQRIYAQAYNLFAHNRIRWDGADSPGAQHWRGHYGDLDVDTAYLVIADNRYEDNSQETLRTINLTVECGGSCVPPGPPGPEDGHDIIIDGNLFAYGNDHAGHLIQAPLWIEKRDVTVRNNIFDWRAFAGASTNISIVGTYGSYSPQNIRAHNNTLIRAGSTSYSAYACVGSSGLGDSCKNNLIYDVDDTDTSLTSGSFSITPEGNVHLNVANCPLAGTDGACGLATTCAATIDADRDCFKLRATGGGVDSVRDAGFTFPETASGYADTVFTDGWGGCRGPSTGGPDSLWDIGAHEYGSTACY